MLLTVKADLQVVVDLDPLNVDFGAVFRGNDASRLVRLVGKESPETKIVAATVEPLGVQRNMTPAPPPVLLAETKDEGETRGVELTVSEEAAAGYFYGQLVVVTDNPKATHLTARVRVKIQSSLVARPERLRFSIPEEGGEQSQELIVRAADGGPLEVLEVGVQHPALSASFSPLNDRRTKVTVTFKGETRSDQEATALVIQTSRKDEPRLEVPVEIYRLRRSTAQTLPPGP